MKRADRCHLANLQVSGDTEGHFLSQQVSGLRGGIKSLAGYLPTSCRPEVTLLMWPSNRLGMAPGWIWFPTTSKLCDLVQIFFFIHCSVGR